MYQISLTDILESSFVSVTLYELGTLGLTYLTCYNRYIDNLTLSKLTDFTLSCGLAKTHAYS